MKKIIQFLRRRWLITLIVSVILLGGFWIFFGNKEKINYLTAPVSRATIKSEVLATGSLQAFDEVDVGAQVSGQISALKIKVGDVVKKGDLLVQIDPRTQNNQLQIAQAALNSDRANLKARQASLKQAQQEIARQKTMFASGATSEEQLQAAQAAYVSAQSALNQAQAQVEQAQVSVSTAKLNLSYAAVTAPIDGTVISVAVKEGQTVNTGLNTPVIATIARLDKMTVKIEISEADITKVKVGMPARFTVLGGQTQYNATVKSIDPAPVQISDNNGGGSISEGTAIYYYGALDVDNPQGDLRMYMTASAVIEVAKAEDVLTIPMTALGDKKSENRYTVDVLDSNNQPQKREITIAMSDGIQVEVTDGLKEGEQIIVGVSGANNAPTMPRSKGIPGH